MRDISEKLINCACTANCIATRIYNGIRDVGSGKQSADNALHSFVESMKDAEELYKCLLELAKNIRQKESTNA